MLSVIIRNPCILVLEVSMLSVIIRNLCILVLEVSMLSVIIRNLCILVYGGIDVVGYFSLPVYISIGGIDVVGYYNLEIGFWNCSNRMVIWFVLFFLHFTSKMNIAVWNTVFSQALVSGNFFLPRYYIYYKVRNRSFVKHLGHRDFRVFSTRRTPAWRNGLHHLKLR